MHLAKNARIAFDKKGSLKYFFKLSVILQMFLSLFCAVLVSKTPNLEHVNFKWNKMTASEFEKHWQEKNLTKNMDFIHMIQVLIQYLQCCSDSKQS